MPDQTDVLAAGPAPSISPDFHIIGAVGRIGDALVYTARDGLKPVRLREYAPPGVVRRDAHGVLRPLDPRLDAAWREGIASFLDKGRRLTQLRHPGVAPAFSVAGSAAGEVPAGYLIGAPVGEPIGAALGRGVPLSPAGIVRLANELAAALAEIHARGLTHLDVSPATVSIASGSLQLSDFAVDDRLFMPLLQTQEGFVRPGFSPIELHDGARAEPLGPAADVYSASALLFTLITGQPPAPWQERWRDPSAAQLAGHGAYPPGFIDAVRKGLAIEPEERHRDGTEWLAALSRAAPAASAPAAPIAAPPVWRGGAAVVPAVPAQDSDLVAAAPPAAAAPPHPAAPLPPHSAAPLPPGPAFPPSPARKSGALIPLLVGALILLALAVGAVFAFQQGWFEAKAPEPAAAKREPRTERVREPTPEPAAPRIALGGTVSGQLTRRDDRRPSGQYQDNFTFAGQSGQRLELRLSSTEFDPLLSMTGPGFSAANDDDADRDTTDSRLVVTLPRTGRYTITVSSYSAGQTGNYVLEVAEPRVTAAIVTPSMLTGRWRRPADASCADPATIRVDGATLEYAFGDFSTVGRVLDGVGRTIRAEMEDGPEGGGEAAFLMAEDGASFTIEGETWLRC